MNTINSNGKYYDSSYGSDSKNTANDWENQALDGFGSIIRLEKGVNKYYFNWIGDINNPTTTQSLITP